MFIPKVNKLVIFFLLQDEGKREVWQHQFIVKFFDPEGLVWQPGFNK